MTDTTTAAVGVKPCTIPPIGWRCTRAAGHEGPCAAVEVFTEEWCTNMAKLEDGGPISAGVMPATPGVELPRPDGYAYRYPDGYIRHNDGRDVNGSPPSEALPWYYESTVRAALAERDALLARLAERPEVLR